MKQKLLFSYYKMGDKMYYLSSLPYEYDSLEPYIDTHTLGLHKNKHQRNYLNKLNQLLLENNYKFNYPLEELYNHIDEFPVSNREDILFNLGGVINHDIYFNSMSEKREEPNIFLKTMILSEYESYDNFKKEFKKKAMSLKGSGYTFLVLSNGKLDIINLFNQDSPYRYNMLPLITIDMWEHAYYLNYKNEKEKYIDNFLEIVDFKQANKKLLNYNRLLNYF